MNRLACMLLAVAIGLCSLVNSAHVGAAEPFTPAASPSWAKTIAHRPPMI